MAQDTSVRVGAGRAVVVSDRSSGKEIHTAFTPQRWSTVDVVGSAVIVTDGNGKKKIFGVNDVTIEIDRL